MRFSVIPVLRRSYLISFLGAAAALFPEIAQAQAATDPMATVEADFRHDRPIVEAFLAGGASSRSMTTYRWFASAGAAPQIISNARFFELIAPCRVREITYSFVLSTRRFGPAPPPRYGGVVVHWTCAGPVAAAQVLTGQFDTSTMSVDLSPDTATEAH